VYTISKADRWDRKSGKAAARRAQSAAVDRRVRRETDEVYSHCDGRPSREGEMGFWKRALSVTDHPSGPRESVQHYSDEAYRNPPVSRWPVGPAPVAIAHCGNPVLLDKLHDQLDMDEREAKEAQRTDRLHGIAAGGALEPWIKKQYPTQDANASFKVTQRKPLHTPTTSDLIHKPKYKLTRPSTSGGQILFGQHISREQRQQQGHGVPIKLVNHMYDWTHYGKRAESKETPSSPSP